MRITGMESNAAIMAELGQRIKDVRIAQGYTQVQLAARAGIATRTLTSIETGGDVRLSSLLAALKALGLGGNVEGLVCEQLARPSDVATLGRKRQRCRARRPEEQPDAWTWGEDA